MKSVLYRNMGFKPLSYGTFSWTLTMGLMVYQFYYAVYDQLCISCDEQPITVNGGGHF
jgi:hypothetical protein